MQRSHQQPFQDRASQELHAPDADSRSQAPAGLPAKTTAGTGLSSSQHSKSTASLYEMIVLILRSQMFFIWCFLHFLHLMLSSFFAVYSQSQRCGDNDHRKVISHWQQRRLLLTPTISAGLPYSSPEPPQPVRSGSDLGQARPACHPSRSSGTGGGDTEAAALPSQQTLKAFRLQVAIERLQRQLQPSRFGDRENAGHKKSQEALQAAG